MNTETAKKSRYHRHFTDEEKQVMMNNMHLSCEEIADLLHDRSKESVMQYFLNRKIKKPKARNNRYYSLEKKGRGKSIFAAEFRRAAAGNV